MQTKNYSNFGNSYIDIVNEHAGFSLNAAILDKSRHAQQVEHRTLPNAVPYMPHGPARPETYMALLRLLFSSFPIFASCSSIFVLRISTISPAGMVLPMPSNLP